MIFGIGTDIIEIARIDYAINNEHFLERVYTLNERKYCESRGRQAAASYAARFAGKEAFFKALGTGIVCSMTCVEILNGELNRPYLNLSGHAAELVAAMKINGSYISLSHSKNYATAVCVLENSDILPNNS